MNFELEPALERDGTRWAWVLKLALGADWEDFKIATSEYGSGIVDFEFNGLRDDMLAQLDEAVQAAKAVIAAEKDAADRPRTAHERGSEQGT